MIKIFAIVASGLFVTNCISECDRKLDEKHIETEILGNILLNGHKMPLFNKRQ